MAFSLNKKANQAVSSESVWRVDHIVGNEFVTVVLDLPIREMSSLDKEILKYLESILSKAGIASYVITSALSKYPNEKDLKKGLTDYYISHNSGWFEQIVKPAREKGMTADVIVAFGPALYQITKTATDFTVDDLIYPAFENYIYVGHGYVGDYDAFVFPQYPVQEVFVPGLQDGVEQVELGCWKMNFMVSVFKKIAAHKYQLPDDMGPVELREIGENYDTDKEGAVKETEEFLKAHFNEDVCAFDLETSGFNAWKCKIRCITLSFDGNVGYYLEWKIFKENPYLIDLLSEMMLTSKHRVTVNGKFDIKFLWVNGLSLDVNVNEDAMTLSHVLCSGRHKGLKTNAFFWTPYGGYDHKLDEYRDNLKKKGIKDPSFYDIPKIILRPYATMDAIITVRIWRAGLKRIQKFDFEYPTEYPIEYTGGHAYGAYEWYQNVMQIYPIICRMEYDGMYVDEEIIEMHRNIFRRKIDEARKELSKIFGTPYDFKYGSAAALGRLLEEKGWPCHGRAKDGSYETSDDCFVEWTRDGMPGVKWLKKFRVANTCLRSYLGVTEKTVDQKRGTIKVEQTGWPQYWVKHPDGSTRIHCNFTVCGTETFRMISREPNLQNVPTHSQEGSITKMSFTVPPAAAATITDENGKKWWITELGIINTERGYVAMKALTEDDTIVDIGEETTLEFDEWMAKGIKPIGMETMLGKHNQILEGKFVLQEE